MFKFWYSSLLLELERPLFRDRRALKKFQNCWKILKFFLKNSKSIINLVRALDIWRDCRRRFLDKISFRHILRFPYSRFPLAFDLSPKSKIKNLKCALFQEIEIWSSLRWEIYCLSKTQNLFKYQFKIRGHLRVKYLKNFR